MKITDSQHRIAELLSYLDIKQTDFCKKTGLQKSALSNYLNGDRVPRQNQIAKIADAYNINPAWLMGYDVPMELDINEPFEPTNTFEKDWEPNALLNHLVALTDEEYSFIKDVRARHDESFYKRMRAYMELFEKRGDSDES